MDTFGTRPGSSDGRVKSGSADPAPLSSHWSRWFRAGPQAGTLLDLCCGNAALLAHMLAVQPEQGLQGIGIELSTASPGWLSQLPESQRQRVEVRSGVSVAALPFADGSVAAVVSQFGVEYAPWPESLTEAVRVLCPGGQLGLVLHHHAGQPAHLARTELAHLQWLEGVEWLSRAETATRGLAVASRGPLGQELTLRARHSDCPDLLVSLDRWLEMAFAMRQAQGESAVQGFWSRVRSALQDNQTRLEDLLGHCLSQDAWQALKTQLEALACVLSAESGELRDQGFLMGWWLAATKLRKP